MPHSAGGENFGSGSFRNGIVVIEAIVYDAGNNELAAISKLLWHCCGAAEPHGQFHWGAGPGYTFAGRDISVKTWDVGFRIPAAKKPSRQSMRLMFPEKGFRLSNSWLCDPCPREARSAKDRKSVV